MTVTTMNCLGEFYLYILEPLEITMSITKILNFLIVEEKKKMLGIILSIGNETDYNISGKIIIIINYYYVVEKKDIHRTMLESKMKEIDYIRGKANKHKRYF